MTATQSLEARRKEALEKFKTIKPRNPPIIGHHCERWPARIERCHKTTIEAIQAMRTML